MIKSVLMWFSVGLCILYVLVAYFDVLLTICVVCANIIAQRYHEDMATLSYDNRYTTKTAMAAEYRKVSMLAVFSIQLYWLGQYGSELKEISDQITNYFIGVL